LVLGGGTAILGLQHPGELEQVAITESWGLIPQLSLLTGAGLLAAGILINLPLDPALLQPLFWGSASIWLLAIICRLAWPSLSRWERVGLLILLACGLYVLKFMASPIGFAGFDEYLHWRTAENILRYGRLFTPNALLPVSPLYPALEIATTAIANLSGLPIFPCAEVFMGILRVLFVCALFLFFERILASTRLASLASLIYMSNWNFVEFDASFAYESLAMVFLILALLAEASNATAGRGNQTFNRGLAAAFIVVLALTHHVTAFFGLLFFALLSVLSLASETGGAPRAVGGALLVIAAAAPSLWSHLMRIPLGGYLGPELAGGLSDMYKSMTTLTLERQPFTGSDGSGAPLWFRVTALAAVGLVCVGLATGFFRSLVLAGARLVPALFPLRWRNSRLVFLTILTLAFPLSMALRLTGGGWELGNRLGPFIYLGIGPVVAVALAGFWQRSSTGRARAAVVGVALTIVMVGGVFSGWTLGDVPRRYRVAADALSIEPMGIGASEWTREWLGETNNFAADRINEILLTTYGGQRLVTNEQTGLDVSGIFIDKELAPEDLNLIKVTGLQYILSDLRLTSALPAYGVYFSKGEPDVAHERPPEASALLKFNQLKDVARLFDDGFIVIYDVRKLTEALRNGRE
jgi:hypothetical protein